MSRALTDQKRARIFDQLPLDIQFLSEQIFDAQAVATGPLMTLSTVGEALGGGLYVRYKGRRIAEFEVEADGSKVRWGYWCPTIGDVGGFIDLSACYRDLVSKLRERGLDV